MTVRTSRKFTPTDRDKVEGKSPNFIHKGIAKRSFLLKWKLLDTIEVQSVDLNDGILTVKLLNVIPESKRPKIFTIGKRLLQE